MVQKAGYRTKKYISAGWLKAVLTCMLLVPLVLIGAHMIPTKSTEVVPKAALDFPAYTGLSEDAGYFASDDLFLVTLFADRHIAFPIRALHAYPVVNDEIGGVPFVATYCVRCQSGIVFDRRISDGRVLTFGMTDLVYNDAMVLLDRETGSYWSHISGASINGPLAGERLTVRSATMLTYDQIKERYPAVWILSVDSLSLAR